uniref:F-box domain-containing protein n=1 Tax=Sus scrofa TaxID=9823 RepID=A0A8D0YW51_PIG
MNSSVTRAQPVGVALPEPEPEEALGLSRLPPELLLMLLSHVPPRTLIRQCRRVCRRWRALVDCQALWLIILARDHPALWPIAQSRLPSARNDANPCILGRFCERRPIGRNLIQNPKGEGFLKWTVLTSEDGWAEEDEDLKLIPRGCMLTSFQWYHKKQVVDLEEEGLWPELLDSGKLEICVSDCLLSWWYNIPSLMDMRCCFFECFGPDGTHPFLCLQVSHVFSNLKKGVRFVSFEQWVWNLELGNEQHGLSLTNSSVIVRVRPS